MSADKQGNPAPPAYSARSLNAAERRKAADALDRRIHLARREGRDEANKKLGNAWDDLNAANAAQQAALVRPPPEEPASPTQSTARVVGREAQAGRRAHSDLAVAVEENGRLAEELRDAHTQAEAARKRAEDAVAAAKLLEEEVRSSEAAARALQGEKASLASRNRELADKTAALERAAAQPPPPPPTDAGAAEKARRELTAARKELAAATGRAEKLDGELKEVHRVFDAERGQLQADIATLQQEIKDAGPRAGVAPAAAPPPPSKVAGRVFKSLVARLEARLGAQVTEELLRNFIAAVNTPKPSP
jgi:hypothetical protein